MIGFLEGSLHRKTDNTATINVNGVGYEVYLGSQTLYDLGEPGSPVSLEIYTHVTESSLQLFGFLNVTQKKLFQKLISVSGIGPKLGLVIIDTLPLQILINAIKTGDAGTLTTINGIGKKTAERLVVELKDKFKEETLDTSHLTPHEAANDNAPSNNHLQDVAQALISLGYSENQARKVVNGLNVEESDTVQTLIRKSLSRLSS